jgi:hemolysin activation/secretion protein
VTRALFVLIALALGAGQGAAQQAPDALPTLKGIVFLPDPSEVRPEGWASTVAGVDAARVPALASPNALAQLQPFIGQPFDLAGLQVVAQTAAAYFSRIGRPFVRVAIPAQDVTAGVVQIVVVESRLGALSVAGNRWFSEASIRNAVGVRPGELLNGTQLNAAVDLLNQNRFHQITPVVKAGQEFGTTDVTLNVRDRFPVSFVGNVGNTGNATTGETQLSAGAEWGNALWRGDTLSGRYTTGSHLGLLHQYSLGYTTQLSLRDAFSISGAYSRTNPVVAPDAVAFGQLGATTNVSPRYLRDLGRLGRLSAGFDWKRTNNDLLFGGESVFKTSVVVAQLAGDYSIGFKTRGGTTNTTIGGVFSPGGIGGANSDEAFSAQRQGAVARYAIARASVAQVIPLPAEFQASATISGQASSAPLLASEQLAFGGDGSVRGFQMFAATRDAGVLASVELRGPAFRPLMRISGGRVPDRLSLFAFADYGAGPAQENADALRFVSAGPGLRYQLDRYASLQLAYGRVLRHDGASAPQGRTHVQLQMVF